ncbi:MAG TPA: hypothetical protein DET40_17575 [Lentisphaeria bacterium]|nr:MAG: hypothetical protein A2X45_02430 [Lentisphaerae bacterium GWF2_50_93]HCE45353.1 hypothetical protein [Lentisphaeria bacterium]
MGKNILEDKSYLEVTYSLKTHPKGPYPSRLACHLIRNYYGRPGKILDIGCGRGDYLQVFKDLGFEVSGVDISPSIVDMSGKFDVSRVDLEKDDFPYSSESFDFIFSKSVVEHMRNPFALMEKSYTGLKKGGVAVIMTPSWEHNYWGPFYIDHTHVTPFTRASLTESMVIAGYKDVEVIYFHQLPFVWKYPMFKPFVRLLSAMPLSYRPFNQDAKWPEGFNKLVRFSKEVMLLGVGHKE